MMDSKENWPHLKELSSLLKSLPSLPKGPGHKQEFVTQDYAEILQDYNEACQLASSNQHSSEQIAEKIRLLKSASTEHISIVSIGCGYCFTELAILSYLQEAFPDMSVTFYGVDLDQTSCAIAEEKLAKLPYQVTIMNEDFLAMDIAKLPKFDFALALRSLDYFPDKKAFLEKALSLLKPGTGRLEFIIGDEGAEIIPVWIVPEIFNGVSSNKLMPAVAEMGLNYTSSTCDGYVHFDRCIKEGFDSRYSRNVMNLLCKTTLEDYPPEVRAACVAHIKSIMDEEHKCYAPNRHACFNPKELS